MVHHVYQHQPYKSWASREEGGSRVLSYLLYLNIITKWRENIYILEFHHPWLSSASDPGGQPPPEGPGRLPSRPAFHCAGEGRPGRSGGLRPSLRQHRLAGLPLHSSLVRSKYLSSQSYPDLDKLNIFVAES